MYITEGSRPKAITFEYASIAAWEAVEIPSSKIRGSGVGLASTVTPSENAISSGSWRGERWGWLYVGMNTGWIAGNAITGILFSSLWFLFSYLTILGSGACY